MVVPSSMSTPSAASRQPTARLWAGGWGGGEHAASVVDLREFPVHWLASYRPQHFLYFLPLPQGQGSLRPVLSSGEAVGVGSCDDSSRAGDRPRRRFGVQA
jgi:hypothetical protein